MGLPKSVPQETSTPPGETYLNKRLHERVAIDRPVHLCWRDRQGNQVLAGRAMDISKFGILVEAEKPIAPGTIITVQNNSTILGSACVRHCTPNGLKYRIGLHMPDRMARGV
jgi:hypothetical protein